MIGTIIGDIEINGGKILDFEYCGNENYMSIDSFMILAVSEICQKGISYSKDLIISTFNKWKEAYCEKQDFNIVTCISPCAWYGRSEEEVKELANSIASAVSNNKDDIKDAKVFAMCVYYAKLHKSKEFINKYVSKCYGFNDILQEKDRINNKDLLQAISCFLTEYHFRIYDAKNYNKTIALINFALDEAYNKGIILPIIYKLKTNYLPKAKGNCDPKAIFSQMEDMSLYSSFNIEQFDQTKDLENITFAILIEENNKYVGTCYSHSITVLSKYILLCYLPKILVNRNEYRDIIKNQKFDEYICNLTNSENELEGWMQALSCFHMTAINIFGAAMNHLNEWFKKEGYNIKITYRCIDDIIDYLKENYPDELYKSVFIENNNII